MTIAWSDTGLTGLSGMGDVAPPPPPPPPPTPSVRSTSGPTAATDAASLALAYHSGGNAPQLGDVILVYLGLNGAVGTPPSTPSGYTLQADVTKSTNQGLYLWSKTALGNESGNLSLSFTTGNDVVGWMVVIENPQTGVEGSPETSAVSTSSTTLNSITPTATGVLTTFAIAADGGLNGNLPSAIGLPSGYTDTSLAKSANTNNGIGGEGAYGVISSATGMLSYSETGLGTPRLLAIASLVQ